MGLFWSMAGEPGFEKQSFLFKRNLTTPLVSKIFIYPQFQTIEDMRNNIINPILCSEIHRWYKAQNVKSIEVEDGTVRGVLFVPVGKSATVNCL